MSLYLLPPTGTVAFHKLEEYATKRLQFLLRLIACNSKLEVESVLEDADVVDQSDCLITNTAKDEISHHILRLTLGGDQESMSFFCESELALFKLRVESMVIEEWTVFFKSAEKFLHRLQGSVGVIALSDLRLVFKILKGQFESWYQLSTEICGQSACLSVSLPFQLALRLVAGRKVNVVKGMAAVPVADLKDVFIELFERLMVSAAQQASIERAQAMGDERIQRLAGILKRMLSAETKTPRCQSGDFPALQLADLWGHSAMFPPCMENVVRVLQDKHTVKHHDRVQLTLFLKELGLPVNDALLLWKREYSVPTADKKGGSCQQRWQGNERRYIYNIRHLYGLEGSRTNYRAHSCSAIQNRALACGDAGGCPFVSHDTATLRASLLHQDLHKDNIEYILKLCQHKMYGNACQSFVHHKLKLLGKICDFMGDERHIKTEVKNFPSKHVLTSDCCIKTCLDEVEHNGITGSKCKCIITSRSHKCGKMLPYEDGKVLPYECEKMLPYECGKTPYKLADDTAVKFQKNCSTSFLLEKNFAGSDLNLQNEMTSLRLPFTHNKSTPTRCVSNSNLIKRLSLNGGGSSVDNKKYTKYLRKRYLFKLTSNHPSDGLMPNGTFSDTSICERNMASNDSIEKLYKRVNQGQEMNSDTKVLQGNFLGMPESPLQTVSRFSHFSKQAEITSLATRKLKISSDVCEDSSLNVCVRISVSASELAGLEKYLSDPVDHKQFLDASEDKPLSGPERERLSNPAKCNLLSGYDEVKLLSDPHVRLSDPVHGEQLSDPSEGIRSSDPEYKCLSDHVKCKRLSNSSKRKWLSVYGEVKHLSDPSELLSDPSEWLSDPVDRKQLSNPRQDLTSGFVDSKLLTCHGPGKQVSLLAENLNSPDFPGNKCSLNYTKCSKLSDAAQCKWLSDPGKAKELLNPEEVGHPSYVNSEYQRCVNSQHPNYQRRTTEYNNFSTLGYPQPPSDPLRERKPTGSVEMKPDIKFLGDPSHRGELFQSAHAVTERESGSLQLPLQAETAVPVKKPRDIYWFSRGLLQL